MDLFSQPAYHNTTNSKGVELAIYEGKAKGQENIVKAFFEERPGQKFIADNVWKILIGRELIHNNTPYTSIRRACSNLSSEKWGNKLIKLDEQTEGFHGKPAHYYILNDNKL